VRKLEKARVSYGHGTTNAHDEAAWLVLRTLDLPLHALVPHLDRVLSTAEVERIAALMTQRIRTRRPAAYLLHEAWLGDYRFYVDERVIVPRSYIAELLQNDLAPWVAAPSRIRSALDLCTGSGCLAILLAHSFKRAHVDAADLSSAALEVAERNIADYRLSRRVSLVQSDLFQAVSAKRYDLIISNPPYVSTALMRRLPAEHRREPALALAGGSDGLDLVRRILIDAPAHLNERGVLVVEVGHHRLRVERAFPRLPLIWLETSAGDDCVFVITREALLSAAPPRSRATRGAVLPRQAAAPSLDLALSAGAKQPRRSARASGGSR
jgi:ribosomal protein L3 glutamine methyltransferase